MSYSENILPVPGENQAQVPGSTGKHSTMSL